MSLNPIELTSTLIGYDSVSTKSNTAVSDLIQEELEAIGFEVERLTYLDEQDEEKVSLVGRKGSGSGGLGLFSHSDVVPGGEGWAPFSAEVKEGRLFGRGACDMKGPLAATLAAAASFDASELNAPLFIAVTSDEERGHRGAHHIVEQSQILAQGWPRYTVVCEPTRLQPVYAHKGGARITVTAHGVAAHTSTDQGESANFKIAPFLGEIAGLVDLFRNEKRFQNDEFNPPTNGFNLVLDDGGTAINVTAEKSVATIGLRAMPNAHFEEAIEEIVKRARAHDLEVTWRSVEPFYGDADGELARLACEATGVERAVTVPFGTEAEAYQHFSECLVLGPGDIAQAHTIGEYIEIEQLERGVEVYKRLINACLK